MGVLWGARLSPDEIVTLLASQMELDWHCINLCAIVLAESGGHIHAVNLNDKHPASKAYLSLDLGLFQLNQWWHPALPIRDHFTPAAQLAFLLVFTKRRYAWGYDWSSWTTWRTGAVWPLLGTARAAVNAKRVVQGLPPI